MNSQALEKKCQSISVGIVVRPASYYTRDSDGIRTFRNKNIGDGKIVDKDWVYITPEGHTTNQKSALQKGDVLVARSGNPGAACVVTEEYANTNCVDTLIIRPDKNALDADFLSYFINSELGKNQIAKMQGGLALQHCNVGEIRKLKVPEFSVKHQKQIVEVLTDCDITLGNQLEMIKQHEKLLHALTDREMSNPSNFRVVKLGQILNESRMRSTFDDPSKRLSVRLHLKGVKKRLYRGTEAENSTLFFERKAGQLIYGKQNIFNGAIGLVPHELDGFASTQDIPAFDIHEDVDRNWLLSFMSRPNFFRQLERYASGSGSKRLHPEELFRIKVKLPHLDEQLKSTTRLKDARCALENAKRLGDLFKRQKRGLVLQLLTGKLRVQGAA